jgi:hypothetical protein
MSKCPKCNAEIDHLRVVADQKSLFSFDGRESIRGEGGMLKERRG